MHIYLNMQAPSAGMSRYSYTDANGYRVGPVIEAKTASDARDILRASVDLTGRAYPLRCTHLSDSH